MEILIYLSDERCLFVNPRIQAKVSSNSQDSHGGSCNKVMHINSIANTFPADHFEAQLERQQQELEKAEDRMIADARKSIRSANPTL